MVLEQIGAASGDVFLGIALTVIEVIAEYLAEAIVFILGRILS